MPEALRYSKIIILAGLCASPALAADPPEPTNVEITAEFNVFTEAVNHWEATGAFEDEGTIKHDHSEVFKGSTAQVTDTPNGASGTFTWTFQRSFTRDPHFPGLFKSSGGWRMIGGTGAYEGISGQGSVTGTFNAITGQVNDRFVGKVVLPED